MPTVIARGGDQQDDMVYVEDVAEAIVRAVLADRLTHDTYNVASGRGSTLHDFAAAVREVFPDATIDIGPGLDYLQMGVDYYSVFDLTRARGTSATSLSSPWPKASGTMLATMRRLGIEPLVS